MAVLFSYTAYRNSKEQIIVPMNNQQKQHWSLIEKE